MGEHENEVLLLRESTTKPGSPLSIFCIKLKKKKKRGKAEGKC